MYYKCIYFTIFMFASQFSFLHVQLCFSLWFPTCPRIPFLKSPRNEWSCCFSNWLNVFNPHRLFGSWSTFVATGVPSGCWFSKIYATNFSLIGVCCSFVPFNCNYVLFSLQPQTIYLLLAVQEFMNRCIYFVLQRLLHLCPFCLSCNCTSTLAFYGNVLSCSPAFHYRTQAFILQHVSLVENDGQPSALH